MLIFEKLHEDVIEESENISTKLKRFSGWLGDALVNTNVPGHAADVGLSEGSDQQAKVIDVLVGAMCKECGQYFRRGRSEFAADHLASHGASRGRRPGRFEFHPSLALLTFGGGFGALMVSVSSLL